MFTVIASGTVARLAVALTALAAALGVPARAEDNNAPLLSGNTGPVLSENQAHLLSGNAPRLLSGNSPAVLSGNQTHVLSDNNVPILSGNRMNVLSGIKLNVEIVHREEAKAKPKSGGGKKADPVRSGKKTDQARDGKKADQAARAQRRFKQLDADGDGLLSLAEYLGTAAK